MKLILDKLGRIEHAELEIRPLTVLVGENNTNKTWAAYCLYGLARKLMIGTFSGLDHPVLPVEPEAAADAIADAVRRTIAQIPRGAEVAQLSVARKDLIQSVAGPVTFRFPAERIYELLHLDVLPEASAAMVASAEEFARDESIAEIQVNRGMRSVSVTYGGPGMSHSFAFQAAKAGGAEALLEPIAPILTHLAHGFMGRAFLFLMPAERKALLETYKLLLGLGGAAFGPRPWGQISRVPDLEEFISAPLIEFMRVLAASENAYEGTPRPGTFVQALAYLERGVLGGAVDYERVGEGVRLSYATSTGVHLPMQTTSSLVRALAGLDLYLRYWANPGDLLVIDEPEMNAHPEAQVRIAELIAYLVNKGVRVVLTTHSPYIVDHLNNLIRVSDLSEADQAEVAPHFRLGTAECFLRAEDVAAYLFQADGDTGPVSVTPILDREQRRLIDWETFGRTTEYVTNLYSAEILARLYR